MNETILLSLCLVGFVILILIAHWFDRKIVKKIEDYEDRMVEKGIYKRHFTKKGKN